MNEQDAMLALNAVAGVGPARLRKLMEHFGSASRVFSVNEFELSSTGFIPKEVAGNIFHFPKEKFLENEYNLIASHGVSLVTIADERYPALLRMIIDHPPVLYVKGTIPHELPPTIAIVGSRRASLYGLSVAEHFALDLSTMGWAIVSGLARGIDTAAHQGALKAKGMTLAVLGCGLSFVYPEENRKLFERIGETGAVISEFPMQTPPRPQHFPQRNRIISGLSLGVLVVEAALKSGALITTDFALEQGREVFAIPGRVDNPSSRGVHNLVKQGAKLVTGIDDILDELNDSWSHSPKNFTSDRASEDKEVPALLTDKEKMIYSYISDSPISVDELAARSGCAVQSATSTLLGMEMKRIVRQMPGKLFVK